MGELERSFVYVKLTLQYASVGTTFLGWDQTQHRIHWLVLARQQQQIQESGHRPRLGRRQAHTLGGAANQSLRVWGQGHLVHGTSISRMNRVAL